MFVPGMLSNVPAICYVLPRGAAVSIFQVFLVSTCKGTRCDEGHGEGERCRHRKAAAKLPSHQEWWSKGTTRAKAEQKPKTHFHPSLFFILLLLRQSSSLQAAEDPAALLLGNTLQLKTIGEKSLPSFHDQLL